MISEQSSLFQQSIVLTKAVELHWPLAKELKEIAEMGPHEKYGAPGSIRRSKRLLRRFRHYFFDHPRDLSNRALKLEALQFLATVRMDAYNPNAREEYDEKKHIPSWEPHINNHGICFICSGKAQVRHHLIQLQNGGRNSYNNIRALCNSCHPDIHPWLKNKRALS